jgi:adenosylcobinamide-phosphate synthase
MTDPQLAMILAGVGAVALAATLDWLIREPPSRVHPVAWFGRAVAVLDRDWSRPLVIGALGAALLPLAAASFAGLVVWAAWDVDSTIGTVVAGFVSLDAATNRASVSLSEADPVLALSGVGLIVLGAVTYAFSTRFKAAEMGNAKDDDDERSNNG